MKMFFGGSAAFAATLLSSALLFDAKPLFAEGHSTRQPASAQQEKTDTTVEEAEVSAVRPEPVETRPASDSAATVAPSNAAASTSSTGEAPSVTILPETPAEVPETLPALTAPQAYVATAYSLPGRTASGMRVAKGIIAADPRVLPLGTRVRLDAGPYSGEYVVADTGSAVRGRKIDVWVPTYREACRFGRRTIKLSILSYGGRRSAARAGSSSSRRRSR
ncbi:MAG TPA: 3D domain-containing protein [Pyrinomonadaceae bacterium]|jgi:3D (Asp-Asp-Asp) domain-containing protein|nr:3D domain-containing protein [Pyrinomonadaceae bacterium]